MNKGFPTLRGKVAAAIVLGALVPLALCCGFIYLQTSASLQRLEGDRLLQSSTAFTHGLAQDQNAGLAVTAASSNFRRSVASHDGARVLRSLWKVVQTRNLVQADVLDAKGHLIAQASILDTPQRLVCGTSGVSFQGFLGKPWLVTAMPIRVRGDHGRQLGTLLAAAQVTDALVTAVTRDTGIPVSIFVHGELAASSAGKAARVYSTRAASGDRRTSGGWMTFYSQLLDGKERPVALAAVSVPSGPFDSMRSSTYRALQLAMILCVLAAVVAALLLANTVTRPVRALTAAVRAISGGDWSQHIEVRGVDEVAVLASAFNDMSEQVAHTVGDLSRELQRLSSELADISVVGEALSQSSDVRRDLLRIAKLVKEMTGSDFCGFHVLDGHSMTPGLYAGEINGATRAIHELAVSVAKRKTAISTTDLARDTRVSRTARRAAGEFLSAAALPLMHQGRALGAVTIGTRGVQPFSDRTAAILSTVASQATLALSHAETFEELERSYLKTVIALAAALEAKDEYTAGHGASIADLATGVGRILGLTGRQLRELEFASVLHDVGKIGVPAHILSKRGPLTAEERASINQHTIIGERIVSKIDYLRPLAPIIRSAHERWDGAGYPDRLAGEAIPLESRIVFVCDAFHAMTSERPYSRPRGEEEAVEELLANAGTQFDPAVVTAFIETRIEAGAMGSSEAHLSVACR